MSENSTQSQFYGWGMTFNMLRKIPAIKNRIFNTYDNMMDYLNDVNGSAIEGLLLTVVKDSDNNGVYFVEKIKKDENDSLASVIKLSSETNIITNNDKYLTITALEDDLTVSFTDSCRYSLNGTDWNGLSANTETPAINTGQKIYFKALSVPNGNQFTVSKPFNLSGNCMSMIFGDEAEGKTNLTDYDNAFSMLFSNTPVVNVSPDFLPATTLAEYCYDNMFAGCTSLSQAPELPATTLAEYCYNSMFSVCTSLVTAPELPAKTLANYCYDSMFAGCESLVQAPELPATELVIGCYGYMFNDCTSLNYIKMLATDISAYDCLFEWVYNVSPTGTFVKSKDATWNVTGINGIPEGWTVKDDYTVEERIDILEEKINNINTDDPSIELPYLTITALEDDLRVVFSNSSKYSLDGTVWNDLGANTETHPISTGKKIYFKAELTPNGRSGIGTFTVSKPFNLSGNVMSMIFGDEAEGKTDLTGYNYAFSGLFINTPVVNAPKLPATTLAEGCYQQMFRGCTSLVTAPKLPATTLAVSCYNGMFRGCTSLVTAPKLPATELASNCYSYMFQNCNLLVQAPELPATTLAVSCYNGMFQGCTSLVNAPELPATTLAEYCYNQMFSNCTSLVNAPELPATTLAEYCYNQMFRGCTSLNSVPSKLPATTLAVSCYTSMFQGCTLLVTAPELPATTLANYCYQGMFNGCKLLLQAPELPATTLAEYCYNQMFRGCTSLNYIRMLATDINANNCLSNWVNGVSLTGTFVRSEDATWIETGDNGIPEGWNILPYTPLTITALENETEISFSNNCEFSLDNKKWRLYTKNTKITISNGGKVYFRGNLKNESDNIGIGTFKVSKPFDISGNVMSMLFNDEIYGETDLTGYEGCFTKLFYNTPVVNVSPTFLPATILASGCYRTMFQGCTSLVTPPELPAKTLANYCYNGMFQGCASLNTLPSDFLPATKLESSCYESMFSGCTSLNTLPSDFLPATALADGCYRNMFYSCTSLNTLPSDFLPATELASSCYESMFYRCTSLETTPSDFLPATELASNCYNSMFQGCTSLVNVPTLPATELASNCYSSMFQGCTSLDTLPSGFFSATALADYCYSSMFQGCTSLSKVPPLSATALADYCYSSMFQGCTSLANAPILPATKLESSCYENMFSGCTSLNSISMMANDINVGDLGGIKFYKSTQNWLSNVSKTGTFVMSKDAIWNPEEHRSVDGIPVGWTVETA